MANQQIKKFVVSVSYLRIGERMGIFYVSARKIGLILLLISFISGLAILSMTLELKKSMDFVCREIPKFFIT